MSWILSARRPHEERGGDTELCFLTPEDAKAYQRLCLRLDGETRFRLYGPGERPDFLLAFTRELTALTRAPNSCVVGARDGRHLVGCLAAHGHTAPRAAHIAAVSIAILQSHTARGLGGRMFAMLEGWARERGICRLELTVSTDNEPALKLYTRLGFRMEGRRQRAMKYPEGYADEFYMAKLLDAPPQEEESGERSAEDMQ